MLVALCAWQWKVWLSEGAKTSQAGDFKKGFARVDPPQVAGFALVQKKDRQKLERWNKQNVGKHRKIEVI